MRKWIVLLRGINVSGQKKIIMVELRSLIESAGFSNVQTYIQSGNIILDAEDSYDQFAIESRVSQIILKHYSYKVDVFALEPSWLEKTARANPFLNLTDVDTRQLALAILDTAPGDENIKRLDDFNTDPDEYVVSGRVIYIRYVNGAGKSKLSNNLIESKLRLKATGRNWNTTLKLIAMCADF